MFGDEDAEELLILLAAAAAAAFIKRFIECDECWTGCGFIGSESGAIEGGDETEVYS